MNTAFWVIKMSDFNNMLNVNNGMIYKSTYILRIYMYNFEDVQNKVVVVYQTLGCVWDILYFLKLLLICFIASIIMFYRFYRLDELLHINIYKSDYRLIQNVNWIYNFLFRVLICRNRENFSYQYNRSVI